MQKFGRVVIVGRPNTGKSTLLNAIMNQKVAITSPLPQTTRKSIRVVYGDDRGKIVFSDTPGIINKVEDLVGKSVNTEAPKEVSRASVIICLVDVSRPKSEEENKVIGLLRKVEVPKVLVYNKIDQAIESRDHFADYNYLEDEFTKVISISALKGKYIKGLVDLIFELLPEVESKKIEADAEVAGAKGRMAISMGSMEYISEIIREKAYLCLREEVPYSVTVVVDSVNDKGNIIVIKARILTTADRYKKMIIGKEGRKIRQIGHDARKELELMSKKHVFLELLVDVDKHWPERMLAGE